MMHLKWLGVVYVVLMATPLWALTIQGKVEVVLSDFAGQDGVIDTAMSVTFFREVVRVGDDGGFSLDSMDISGITLPDSGYVYADAADGNQIVFFLDGNRFSIPVDWQGEVLGGVLDLGLTRCILTEDEQVSCDHFAQPTAVAEPEPVEQVAERAAPQVEVEVQPLPPLPERTTSGPSDSKGGHSQSETNELPVISVVIHDAKPITSIAETPTSANVLESTSETAPAATTQ